ncbi:MAG TPA: universal stress protein [Polyangiaceae bacterium]|nr:universal stress protein [Polyangiaceae bacterium]
MKIQSILVPVDYSECSAAAVTLAIEVASKFGAELDVVHVWDRPTYVSEDIQVGHGDGAHSLIELIRANAEREMAQFIAELSVPPRLKCSTRLLSGNPAATILKVLQDGKHQLLVMGTHGRTGLRHVLLGSVAEKLVRLSPVPVLTVPPDRESQP